MKDKHLIRVFFYNFGYSDHAPDLESAIALARKAGFQSSLWQGDVLLGSYCPISGYRTAR